MLRRFVFLLVTFSAFSLGYLFNPTSVSADIGGLVDLINDYRQDNGKNALKEDQKLVTAACWLAEDMGKNNSFSHTDSLGRDMATRLAAFGVSGSTGENIYYTTSGSAASNPFNGWKNSSGHNAIMLSGSYTRIGVGRAYYNGRWYWVADFANGSATAVTSQCAGSVSPPPAPPPPPPNPNPAPPPNPAATKKTETPVPIATKSAKLAKLETTEVTGSSQPTYFKSNLDPTEPEKNEARVAVLAVRNDIVVLFFVLANLLVFGSMSVGLWRYKAINQEERSPSFPNSDQSSSRPEQEHQV